MADHEFGDQAVEFLGFDARLHERRDVVEGLGGEPPGGVHRREIGAGIAGNGDGAIHGE